VQIATHYHSEFRGIIAHQDFRVINLWEIDAEQVFAQNLKTLLPFTPILKGGQQERLLQRAIIELRATPEIAEMEPLLAFFASFVLQTDVVRRLMRWDMTVLRESPWYNEILKEGLEQGYQKGIQQGMQQGMQQGREQAQVEILLHILRHRFGEISADLALQLRKLSSEQLGGLIDIGLDAQSLAEFLVAFQKTPPSQS
jgi:predicted transposase YdaD